MVKCPVCQKGEIVTERITEESTVYSMGHESQDSPRVVEMEFYEHKETVDILDEEVYCTNCKTSFEHEVSNDTEYYITANLEKVVLK